MNNKGFIRLNKFALIAALILCPTLVFGDIGGLATGHLATADVSGTGVGYIGGFVGLGNDATSIFGSITYGFSDYTEGRFKFGFSDADTRDADPVMLIGFDYKYEFMDYYDKNGSQPMDMALGGFFELVNYQGASVLELGGNFIASIPYRFDSGRKLIPYGRANFRLEKVSIDNADNRSDFKFGLNLGVKYELTTEMNVYGEIQMDSNAGLFLGLDVRMF